MRETSDPFKISLVPSYVSPIDTGDMTFGKSANEAFKKGTFNGVEEEIKAEKKHE
jgi:hypothetical protein